MYYNGMDEKERIGTKDTMELAVIGLSYKEADLEIREKVSFTDTRKMELFRILEEKGIQQSVILSTCNRSEVYFLWEEEKEIKEARKAYEAIFRECSIDSFLMEKRGKEAAAYLFLVAAGMESLVLGEDQILGQVVEAAEFARNLGYAKKELNKIFRDAITCGKKIKTEFKISGHPLSMAYIGLKRLNRECPLNQKRVLVIGSGKMASLALVYLREFGCSQIYVCGRSPDRLKELKMQFREIRLSEFEKRYEVMRHCQAVISATSAPHIIIKKEKVWKPLERTWLLDLAAPRDMDKELGNDPDFVLYDIDSLKQMAEESQKQRKRLAGKARERIWEDVEELMEWLKNTKVDTTICSLQKRCSAISQETFQYLNRKIDLNEREKGILRKTLDSSFKRLIREPIQSLKQLESQKQQEIYMEAIRQLFQFDPDEE